MWTDLSRFKVIHGGKVLNAVAIAEIRMPEGMDWEDRDTIIKPKQLMCWQSMKMGIWYPLWMRHGRFNFCR